MALTYAAKLRLDRLLGGGLAWAIAPLVAARRRTAPPSTPRAIVVAKIVGLGSLVRACTLLNGLRRRYPDARLIVLTRLEHAPLAERLVGVSQVVTIDDRSVTSLARSVWSAVRLLRALRVDTYVDLEVYSNASAVLSWLSGASRRLGLTRRAADQKSRLYTDTVLFNTHAHIDDVLAVFLARLDAGAVDDVAPALHVSAADHHECEALFARHGLGTRDIIAINVNASSLMLERRWPAASWQRCLPALAAALPESDVVLIGHTSERTYVQTILDACGPNPRLHNVAGEVGLGGLMALLTRSRLLVSGDTGPLHLAAALGTPTVSIWGPTAPSHLAPRRGRHVTLAAAPFCSPCLHHVHVPPCNQQNICMSLTPVAAVVEAAAHLVGTRVSLTVS